MTGRPNGGRRARRAAAQRGSALTESIVLMAAMLPLMFAIPMLGKLVDVNQTTVQAGRYAVWEATVHEGAKGAAPGAEQVAGRFFGAGDEPILSDGVAPGTNALWGDGTDADGGWDAATGVEIDAGSVETLRYAPADDANLPIAGAVGGAVHAAGSVLGAIAGADWDLGETALTRAGVRVEIERNGWFDDLVAGCGGAFACLEEAGTIMTDGWSAGSTQEMKDRVQALVPASVLEPVGKGLSALGHVPILDELKPLDTAFGHVGDFVPPDAERDGQDTYGLPAYVEE